MAIAVIREEMSPLWLIHDIPFRGDPGAKKNLTFF